MNSFDFGDIVKRILADERIDLAELARKSDANRSYLSKVVNSKKELTIGVKVLGKVKRSFPGYFPLNNESDANGVHVANALLIGKTEEPSAMQIFHLLAKTLESHGRILDRIDEKMARADAQARIETNSIEILAGVRSLSIRQKRAIAENKKDLSELKSAKHPRGRGSSKKSGQTDGVGKRQDKKPPLSS